MAEANLSASNINIEVLKIYERLNRLKRTVIDLKQETGRKAEELMIEESVSRLREIKRRQQALQQPSLHFSSVFSFCEAPLEKSKETEVVVELVDPRILYCEEKVEGLKELLEELECGERNLNKDKAWLAHKVEEASRKQIQLQDVIKDTQQAIKENREATYNGKCVMNVDGFSQQQACGGNDGIRMCSSPFYTSAMGYKVRLVLFPSGTGEGKGSHLSVHLNIMKGHYDALLPWPMKQKVQVGIYNYNDGQFYMSKLTLTPSCTSRPMNDANESSGLDRFLPLGELEGDSSVISADRIYIRCEIEQEEFVKNF